MTRDLSSQRAQARKLLLKSKLASTVALAWSATVIAYGAALNLPVFHSHAAVMAAPFPAWSISAFIIVGGITASAAMLNARRYFLGRLSELDTQEARDET